MNSNYGIRSLYPLSLPFILASNEARFVKDLKLQWAPSITTQAIEIAFPYLFLF